MERTYRSITTRGAIAKMRADAGRLGAEYLIAWTARDTVFPAPLGVLWLVLAAAAFGLGVLAWPLALPGAGIALLVGLVRIRECAITATYLRRAG